LAAGADEPAEMHAPATAPSGTLAHAQSKAGQIGQFRRMTSRQKPLDQVDDATGREVDNDFVMPHALAALDRAEISHETIMTVAHASQSAIPEHRRRMHSQAIQSNLDGERLKES
jgi:hypothetical protein